MQTFMAFIIKGERFVMFRHSLATSLEALFPPIFVNGEAGGGLNDTIPQTFKVRTFHWSFRQSPLCPPLRKLPMQWHVPQRHPRRYNAMVFCLQWHR